MVVTNGTGNCTTEAVALRATLRIVLAWRPEESGHMGMCWYNENDPEKAEWIRELMKSGVIAEGTVDERSIEAIQPDDLREFRQCHFFAGISVWSYALRLAGWPDNKPVWSGSCPCPSFSAAGQGQGFDDARHLWPYWSRLIGECHPATIFGEQADDAIGFGWLDLVQTDLEAANYAFGKAVLGACSVGAPHIRQRLYFVAHAEAAEVLSRSGEVSPRTRTGGADGYGNGSASLRMEHADIERCREKRSAESRSGSSGRCSSGDVANSDLRGQPVCGITKAQPHSKQRCEPDGMGNSNGVTGTEFPRGISATQKKSGGEWFGNGYLRDGHSGPSQVNGFWRNADWILRRKGNGDGAEWCPVEPGTFPLVAGAPARVLRLRGYGDAINAEVAKAFIEASIAAVREANP